MVWAATAVIGSAVIGAYAANQASKAQSKATRDAARSSNAAAVYQADIQKDIYDQTREDQAPWREVGRNALTQLAYGSGVGVAQPVVTGGNYTPAQAITQIYRTYLGRDPDPAGLQNYLKEYQSGQRTLSDIERVISSSVEAGNNQLAGKVPAQQPAGPAQGGVGFGELTRPFSMADFEADPGYGFRQDEGQKLIERGAAAQGGLLSGRAIKAAQRFGQDLASQEYGNAFNRFQSNQANQFNRLASLAGVGQTANNALQQAGGNYANAMTNISQNNAMNQGNALLAQGNARASGYAGIGNAIGGGLQAYGMMRPGGFGGYQMGTGALGNNYAMSQGYLPLNHSAANAGFYD